MNYNINDTVLYGADGICVISEITEQKIGTEIHKYYILKPIYDKSSTVMVPISNSTLTNRIRLIPTKKELDDALNVAKYKDVSYTENDNDRKERFHRALDTSDLSELLCITKQLYAMRKLQENKGKKLHVSDERMLKETEKILFDCFAHIYNMEHTEATAFVRKNLKTS